MEENTSIPVALPRLNEKAPEFTAVTTQGEINFPSDYRGKWVILFSHPADFTPVCTTEFLTFAAQKEKFANVNCDLVGLSVDGLYSHIAWLRTIKEKISYRGMKDVEVDFPLIEDITMNVAKKYGMIQPGEDNTKAVRAVFIIDPESKVRAMIYYPLSLGRNFDEIYRALVALQTADAFDVATPADWRPGDDVIVGPAGSCGQAKERMDGNEEMECQDWFFCSKKLDEKKVWDEVLVNGETSPEPVLQK
ncbi:MAG: peroxiredoxin [Spirochaetales bacterium]|nr:peroxiredoxin [Spirochaetales bacterium]